MTVTGIFSQEKTLHLCGITNLSLLMDGILNRLTQEVEHLKADLAKIRANANFLDDPLLDSATVCQFLSMSYRQLKTYKQQGEIVPIYNGRKCLYPTSEVRRFVQEVLKVKGKKLKKIILSHEK